MARNKTTDEINIPPCEREWGMCDNPSCDPRPARIDGLRGREYCSEECRDMVEEQFEAKARMEEEKQREKDPRIFTGQKHRGDGSYTLAYKRFLRNR